MTTLTYTIVRRPRRRTVSIIVQPDRTVRILAPAALPEETIARIAEGKRKWILDRLAELDNLPPLPPLHRYLPDEPFLWRGKRYPLALVEGRGRIHLREDRLEAAVPLVLSDEERAAYLRKRLQRFYETEAGVYLGERTRELGRRHDLKAPYVAVKDYRSRWGCCFTDGRIYYNWRIIMAPQEIIDYVIVHELCHLREANHGKRYWSLVEALLPDWRERRLWLRRHGHTLTL